MVLWTGTMGLFEARSAPSPETARSTVPSVPATRGLLWSPLLTHACLISNIEPQRLASIRTIADLPAGQSAQALAASMHALDDDTLASADLGKLFADKQQ